MSAAVFVLGRIVVLVSSCLILFSFGSLSLEAGNLIPILVSLGLITLIPVCFVPKMDSQNNFYFPWFLGFIIWLSIQAFGQGFGLPFFGEAGPWSNRINLLVVFFTGFGFFFIITKILRNRSSLIAFLQFYVIASTLLAFYSLFFLLLSPKLPENFPGHFPLLEPLKPWIGIVLHPNDLVDLFFPGTFFSLSLVFYWNTRDPERQDQQKIVSMTLLNLCFACILMAAILFDKSRGGIIAFFVSLFLYFFLFTLVHQRRKAAFKRLIMFLTVLGIFLLTLGLKDILQEMRTMAQSFAEEAGLKGIRSLVMGASWQLVKSKGLFGVGLGNFHAGWFLYHNPPFNLFPQRSYNDFLWMWAEIGVPGLILFWGGLIYFVLRSAFAAWKTERYSVAYISLASLSTVMALAVHSLVDPTFYVTSLFWTFSIVVGVGCAAQNLESRIAAKNGSPNRRRVISYGIIFLLAVMMGWFMINRVRAREMSRKSADQNALIRASKLDPFNPVYPEDLAVHYASEYEKNFKPEDLEKSLEAIDRAIDIDPIRLLNYVRRASVLLKSEDEAGIRETFEIMRKKLPRFYLAELIASAFYMNAAVESKDPRQVSRMETQAFRHYVAALELYPEFETVGFLSGYTSQTAFTRFMELRQARQLRPALQQQAA